MRLIRLVLMYIFLLCIFIIFYYVYLEILRFKICFENFAKSKQEEKKKRREYLIIASIDPKIISPK